MRNKSDKPYQFGVRTALSNEPEAFSVGQLVKEVGQGIVPDIMLVVIGYPDACGNQNALSIEGAVLVAVNAKNVLDAPACLVRQKTAGMYQRLLTKSERLAATGLDFDRMPLSWIESRAGQLTGVREVLRLERVNRRRNCFSVEQTTNQPSR